MLTILNCKISTCPSVINLSEEALIPKIEHLNPAVHVDTGMRRLGIPHYETDRLLDLVEHSKPSLLMSHLAKADEPLSTDNLTQLERFNLIRHELGGACPNSSLPTPRVFFWVPHFILSWYDQVLVYTVVTGPQ